MNKILTIALLTTSILGCKSIPTQEVKSETVKKTIEEKVVEKEKGTLVEVCERYNRYTDSAVMNKEVSFDVVVQSHKDGTLRAIAEDGLRNAEKIDPYYAERYYKIAALVTDQHYKKGDIINITGIVNDSSSLRLEASTECFIPLKTNEPVTTKLIGHYKSQ